MQKEKGTVDDENQQMGLIGIFCEIVNERFSLE